MPTLRIIQLPEKKFQPTPFWVLESLIGLEISLAEEQLKQKPVPFVSVDFAPVRPVYVIPWSAFAKALGRQRPALSGWFMENFPVQDNPMVVFDQEVFELIND